MQRYFGPEGLLARKVERFEFRQSQSDMAEAVAECLAGQTPLMVEAGTGTGKTWAYLIPSILSGKKVVVSTGTKTLQDQILDHDIPFLKGLIAPGLQAVCVKGRRNYLCRRRNREFSFQPTLYNKDEARLFKRFQKWATTTKTGDRAEIDWLPDQFHTWHEVCCSSDHCLGQAHCDDFSRCHLTRLRVEASRAQLLVVNHHLFFADLALRRNGLGEVLPEYDAVIFDEAHQLEDVMGLYFGFELSNYKLYELMNDMLKECRKFEKSNKDVLAVRKLAQQLDVQSRLLHRALSVVRGNQGRFTLELDKMGRDFHETCQQIIHVLEQLAAMLTHVTGVSPVFESFTRRSLELAVAARATIEQQDPTLVYWYEVTSQHVFVHGTPIDVAPVFRERLLPKTPAVVLTSATLSVAGSFGFLRDSLGMPPESREMILPSPYAYDKQALLYVPAVAASRFPAPQDPSFCTRVGRESLEILTRTRGRALFLFTSYRNMNEVYLLLRDRLPHPILVQGQKPKRALLTEFKETIDSVLLATSSFWQGIDVPGEALSCLLIDKLPFEVPDDPIIAARMSHIQQQGKSPFFHYQVPRAAILLKQGVGRLIRSSRDKGIVVIFDIRLSTKGYGKLFLKSLPSYRMAHDLDQIDSFLVSHGLVAGDDQD